MRKRAKKGCRVKTGKTDKWKTSAEAGVGKPPDLNPRYTEIERDKGEGKAGRHAGKDKNAEKFNNAELVDL